MFCAVIIQSSTELFCRDPEQQTLQGTARDFVERKRETKAFFEDAEGKIVHVGLYYRLFEIIHASESKNRFL